MSDSRNAYGWDDSEALAKETSRSGAILKLENDGDKALVVFSTSEERGKSLYSFQNLFLGNEEGSLDLSSKKGQAYLDKNPKAEKDSRFRARVGLFVLAIGNDEDDNLEELFRGKLDDPDDKLTLDSLGDEGSFWEISKTVFTDLKKMTRKRPFSRFVFEIERNGAANDKKTTYSILNGCTIDEIDGLHEHLDQVEWRYLPEPFDKDDDTDSKPGKRPSKPSKSDDGKPSGKPSGKQSADERAKIKEIFAAHRELVPVALEAMGVSSLKDLAGDMVSKAEKWLADELAGKHAEPETGGDGDDFFDD